MKTRIELTDSPISAIVKMAEGNPGAAMALSEMFKSAPDIDPDSALGGFGPILGLDSMGIYGSDIYVLHSDICGKDTVKTLAVLRAHQLGFISESVIKDASSRQDRSGKALIPVDELLSQVRERLPKFGA